MNSGSGAVVRPARIEEAEEMAGIWLACRRAAAPRIPSHVRSDDDVKAWLSTRMLLSEPVVWPGVSGRWLTPLDYGNSADMAKSKYESED